MKFIILASIFFMFLSLSECYSQNTGNLNKKDNILELKSKILNSNPNEKELQINTSTAASKKSPALALLFSLILPGAGHYYLDRMDVGKYFLAADAASWLGLASLNVYGNSVRDDSRIFSHQHAGIDNIGNKSTDYFANVGNFNNVYEYNNDRLTVGDYAHLYDVSQYYWNWDNSDNKNHFESQRKSSERIYNTRVVFGSLLIANRIISGISAYLIAIKSPKSSSLNIQPELLYKDNYSVDGVKINLSENF